jgi:hypothetical protein
MLSFVGFFVSSVQRHAKQTANQISFPGGHFGPIQIISSDSLSRVSGGVCNIFSPYFTMVSRMIAVLIVIKSAAIPDKVSMFHHGPCPAPSLTVWTLLGIGVEVHSMS